METKIFVFGLDNAGKTAMTAFIKEDKVLEDPKPTKKFNIENIIISNVDFILWDAPGQVKYRDRWGKGIMGTKILMFVLDTSGEQRFQEAKDVLDKTLNDFDTRGIPVIFCFHKMDLDESKENLNKAREIMKLPLIQDHEVKILKTSVMTGEGMDELKTTLVDTVNEARW